MLEDTFRKGAESGNLDRRIPTVSARLESGAVVEMVNDPDVRRTAFAVWQHDRWTIEPSAVDRTWRLVPYSPFNNLIRNGVVLFASRPEEYGTESELVDNVRAFVHRYVDVSPLYEKIASYYVLLSWLYDDFSELPYLRVRGDPGSGKTRFLLTVGSLCYKPIFASGASTVSPLFRLLDTFRGTLVIDEGDFRFSDEKAEIVKILNNGNAKGFPVLRTEVWGKGEFNPRAYHVFGPKLVATRGHFDDRALESRCLTEEMGRRRLREDVPISHPEAAEREALRLRNQLLLFRFRNLGHRRVSEALVDRTIEPRLSQVFVPLASVIDDAQTQAQLREVAREYHRELITERSMDVEAQVLEIVAELARDPQEGRVGIKEITRRFVEEYGDEYERKVTTKWIGTLVRRRLGLRTTKREGTYVISVSEFAKLPVLREKYGLNDERRDVGDVGDVDPGDGQDSASDAASPAGVPTSS